MIRAHRMGGGQRRGAVVRRIEDRKKKHSKRIKNSGRTHRPPPLVPMATVCRLMVTSFRRCTERKTSVFRYLLSGYGSTGHGLHCKLSPNFITRATVTLFCSRQTFVLYFDVEMSLCPFSTHSTRPALPPYWHCIGAFSQRIG